MLFSRRALLTVLAVAAAALSMAFAAGAVGASNHPSKSSHPSRSGGVGKSGHAGRFDHRRNRRGASLIKASLAPSQPTDPSFHGVKPGGAVWILKRGEVRLTSDGKLDLFVRGLVLPSMGNTAGPVTTISASLYCGADSSTAAAATTQQVPISSSGNARIRDASFTVPSTCLAPVILVHPNGNASAYIALDGWRL